LISEESDEAEVTEKNDEVAKITVKANKGMSLLINSTILMNKEHRITFSRPLLLEPTNRCSYHKFTDK